MSEKKDGASVEISDELRDKILLFYEENKVRLEQSFRDIPVKRGLVKFVEFPIMINGVMDCGRYNVEEGRIDQITIMVADGNVTPVGWTDWQIAGAAYCDSPREVTIPLPYTKSEEEGKQDG